MPSPGAGGKKVRTALQGIGIFEVTYAVYTKERKKKHFFFLLSVNFCYMHSFLLIISANLLHLCLISENRDCIECCMAALCQ